MSNTDTTCPRCQGSGVDYDNGPLHGNGGGSGLPSSYYPLCQGCEGSGQVCACTTKTEGFRVLGYDDDARAPGWYVVHRWPGMTRAEAEGIIRRICETNPYHEDCLPGHCARLRVEEVR